MKWVAVLLVIAGTAWGQTPTRTPNATQDCCLAWNAPGCDDSVCEACVCDGVGGSGGNLPDGVCCFSAWDYQCSQEALGLQGTINCAAQCACSRIAVPSATPTPTDTPLITGQCEWNTPIAGQVQIEEDTPAAATGTPTPTRTPTSTLTATVTGTPPSPTPTPTSVRQDCCECPNACSVPPINGTCPQGCTLIPNACCDCGGGGERPANTATPGGSTAAPRPTTTPTAVRGQ